MDESALYAPFINTKTYDSCKFGCTDPTNMILLAMKQLWHKTNPTDHILQRKLNVILVYCMLNCAKPASSGHTELQPIKHWPSSAN